jgi:hypothetical protein
MAIVYLHKRNDTKDVFYVGIGKSEKRAFSKNSRNAHWYNVVNKIGYSIEITHRDICWEEACTIEIYLISFYREIHNNKICNLNNGGNGNLGYKASLETKKKISESAKISQNKPEVREKRIQGIKKYYISEGARESNRQRQILAYSTQQAREKNRISQNNPDVIDKKRKAATIRFSNLEYRLELSKIQKIAQNRPEVKQKRIKSLSISQNRPEVKRKISDSIKKAFKEGRLQKKVISINQYTKDGVFIKQWDSITEAANSLKLFQQNISTCCRGKSKICGGFIWRYTNNDIKILP